MSLSHSRLPAMGLLVALALVLAMPANAGDPVKGRAVFASECAMCHSNVRNGPAILGPTLFGVVGRHAGSLAGFAYSSGMKAAAFTWSNAQLDAYLAAPRSIVAGTKMPYAGLKNPVRRADLIAFLDTLK